jgi:hypothetical protein
MLPSAGLLIALSTALLTGGQALAAIAPEHEKLFEEKVRPLLVARCQGCHGDRVAEGGLRLDNLPAVLKGGDSGTILAPGDPAASKVLKVVRRELEPAMPPDEPLPADEVAILEAWIAAGAPWSGAGAEGPVVGNDTIPADMEARLVWARERHWAYQPFVRHDAPSPPVGLDPAVSADWSGTVDRFITASTNDSTCSRLYAAATPAGTGFPPPPALPPSAWNRAWIASYSWSGTRWSGGG